MENLGTAIMREDGPFIIKVEGQEPVAKMEGVKPAIENAKSQKKNSRVGNHYRNQLSSKISSSHDLGKVLDQPMRTEGQL